MALLPLAGQAVSAGLHQADQAATALLPLEDQAVSAGLHPVGQAAMALLPLEDQAVSAGLHQAATVLLRIKEVAMVADLKAMAGRLNPWAAQWAVRKWVDPKWAALLAMGNPAPAATADRRVERQPTAVNPVRCRPSRIRAWPWRPRLRAHARRVATP